MSGHASAPSPQDFSKTPNLDKAFLFSAQVKVLDASQLYPQPSPPFVILVNQEHLSAGFCAPGATGMRKQPVLG